MQGLAGMAGGIEAKILFQRGQAMAEQGHAIGAGGQRGRGPQAGMAIDRDDARSLADGQHDEVERQAAVNGGDAIRLEQ